MFRRASQSARALRSRLRFTVPDDRAAPFEGTSPGIAGGSDPTARDIERALSDLRAARTAREAEAANARSQAHMLLLPPR